MDIDGLGADFQFGRDVATALKDTDAQRCAVVAFMANLDRYGFLSVDSGAPRRGLQGRTAAVCQSFGRRRTLAVVRRYGYTHPVNPGSQAMHPIITWLFNTAGKAAVSKALDRKAGLEDRLLAAMRTWADKVTATYADIEPDNLAIAFFSADFPDMPSPDRDRLRDAIAAGAMPTEGEWYAALLERWRQVNRRNRGESVSFFRASMSDVDPLLHELADGLHKTCAQDERLFRVFVADTVRAVHEAVTADNAAKSIRHVVNLCRRMALFTETDYENSTTAMFNSLNSCRASLQQIRDFVQPAEVRPVIDKIVAALHDIDAQQEDYRFGWSRRGPAAAERIDNTKLRILEMLRGHEPLAGEDFQIPRVLIGRRYYYNETDADTPPTPGYYFG